MRFKLVAFLLLLLSFNVNALSDSSVIGLISKYPTCNGGMKVKDQYLILHTSKNTLNIFNLESYLLINHFKFDFTVIDYTVSKNHLLILSKNQFHVVDLFSKEITQSIRLGENVRYAEEIKLINDRIFISTGRNTLEVYSANNYHLLNNIDLVGQVVSVDNDENFIYVLSESSGAINGVIYNSIFILNKTGLELEKETKVYTNPSSTIHVLNEKVFLGNRFYWQLDKHKVLKKKWISGYRSVYIPRPEAFGKPFRDKTYLYYCESQNKKYVFKSRSLIER